MKYFILITVSLLTFSFCYTVGKLFGFSSFTFAWILNFSLMALYTFIAARIPFQLKSSYFKPRKFEKQGRIYRAAGVLVYKKLLVWIGWEKLNKQNYKLKPDFKVLEQLEYQTRSSEFGHAVIFLIVCLTALFLTDTFREAKWLLILNLLLHFYPVILQRYNRPRYKMILDRYKKPVSS